MQSFKKVFTTDRCIGLCAGFGIVIILSMIKASTMSPFSTVSSSLQASSSQTNPSQTATDTQLPEWLQVLDLSDVQIRQVFEIDRVLERRLQTVLTAGQYRQWQASQRHLSDETGGESWTFSDLGIDLSPYQETAVDAAFRESLQSVLSILSIEQSRWLLQYPTEEDVVPGEIAPEEAAPGEGLPETSFDI